MPLTEEQQAALASAADALKGADAKEVADALKASLPDVHQRVFSIGYGTHKGESEDQIKAKDAEIDRLKTAVGSKDEEIAKLAEKTPDIDALRADYEARLQQKDKEASDKLAAAEQKVEALHRSRFKAELKAALVEAGIDRDYAGEVLLSKADSRIEVTPEGAVKVLDDDGLTPLSADAGALPRVFADKLKGSVDPKWIVSNADNGSGTRNGANAGQGGYDPAKAGKEMAEQQKAAAPDQSLAFK